LTQFDTGVLREFILTTGTESKGRYSLLIAAVPPSRAPGIPAPYLLKQLLVIQGILRTAPVMHGVIKDLSKPQMQAVAIFLQSR
jgi:cytochrome c553